MRIRFVVTCIHLNSPFRQRYSRGCPWPAGPRSGPPSPPPQDWPATGPRRSRAPRSWSTGSRHRSTMWRSASTSPFGSPPGALRPGHACVPGTPRSRNPLQLCNFRPMADAITFRRFSVPVKPPTSVAARPWAAKGGRRPGGGTPARRRPGAFVTPGSPERPPGPAGRTWWRRGSGSGWWCSGWRGCWRSGPRSGSPRPAPAR